MTKSDFGVRALSARLKQNGFDVRGRQYQLSPPGNVLLYGCSATGTDNFVVNDGEKIRVQDGIVRMRPSGVTTWLMRAEHKGAAGLSKPELATGVLLFRAPLTTGGDLDRPRLAPTESRRVPGARYLPNSVVTLEAIQRIVDDTPSLQVSAADQLVSSKDLGAADTSVQRFVWTRGSSGRRFRREVLAAYPGPECAFCGFAQRECLEAAHVVPWAAADTIQRSQVSNGIALCRNCHALFDSDLIRLGLSGRIYCEIDHSHERDLWRHGQLMSRASFGLIPSSLIELRYQLSHHLCQLA